MFHFRYLNESLSPHIIQNCWRENKFVKQKYKFFVETYLDKFEFLETYHLVFLMSQFIAVKMRGVCEGKGF